MTALFSLSAAAVTLTGTSPVTLSSAHVTLGDIARAVGIHRSEWVRLEALVVARVPRGRSVVSRKALAALISRRVPGLRVVGSDGPDLWFVAPTTPSRRATGCHALGVARRAGEPILSADVVSAACDGPVSRAVRTGTDHGLVAARDLPAGTVLGRVAVPRAAAIPRGTEVRLVSRTGPVTVERAVTALQPGRSGRRMFVRDGDGQVFAARVEAPR